jgi:hypothetical protein
MPRFRVYGAVEYGKLTEGYLETVLEAADEEAAKQAALAGTFSPLQLARYTINEYLETEETDEPVSPEHGGERDGQKAGE